MSEKNSTTNDFRFKRKTADVVPDAFVDLFCRYESFDKKKGSSLKLEEAIEALRALGYSEREINTNYTRVIKKNRLTTDQYIKKALSNYY